MKKITFRAWDADAAKKDGKPLTWTDRVIMMRSKLTHLEIQFDENRGGVSFSSTMADNANGCRFKYINYSNPNRWKSWTVEVSDEEERLVWLTACNMADCPVDWQVKAEYGDSEYFVVVNFDSNYATYNIKDIALYQGNAHIQYDKAGLMSFALKRSGKWWLNALRGILWGWTLAFNPDDDKVWCSEACAIAWNAGYVKGKVFFGTLIDPYDAMCIVVKW